MSHYNDITVWCNYADVDNLTALSTALTDRDATASALQLSPRPGLVQLQCVGTSSKLDRINLVRDFQQTLWVYPDEVELRIYNDTAGTSETWKFPKDADPKVSLHARATADTFVANHISLIDEPVFDYICDHLTDVVPGTPIADLPALDLWHKIDTVINEQSLSAYTTDLHCLISAVVCGDASDGETLYYPTRGSSINAYIAHQLRQQTDNVHFTRFDKGPYANLTHYVATLICLAKGHLTNDVNEGQLAGYDWGNVKPIGDVAFEAAGNWGLEF